MNKRLLQHLCVHPRMHCKKNPFRKREIEEDLFKKSTITPFYQRMGLNICVCVVLTLLFSQRLVADELLIVVARDSAVTKINSRQLERIFRRKILINQLGDRWVPINLGIENPIRLAFSKRLFKQSPAEMEAFWNVQYFKGISPPYVVSSEEAVLRFVTSTPGAIGYINSCHLDSRVRVLMKLTIDENIQSLCKTSKNH